MLDFRLFDIDIKRWMLCVYLKIITEISTEVVYDNGYAAH